MDLATLKQKMDEAHYIYDETLVTVLYVALKLGRPLLIEGAAGVGKTEIAKVSKSMEELRQSFLDFFSVEFTDKVLAEAQAHKDLIVVDGNTYVAYNKSGNRADFINSWVNSVRDDGNGRFRAG